MTKKPDAPDEEVEDWTDVETAFKWRKTFLEELRKGASVRSAALAAGIGHRTAYRQRQRHERFALAWTDAVEEGTDILEDEALRRAVHGVETPVISGGAPVFLTDPATGAQVPMTVLKHSDTLLIFLLKARRPAKFRDVWRVEQSGPDGGPIRVEEVGPRSAERIRELVRIARESGFGDDD